MKTLPLKRRLRKYLQSRNLEKQFTKQAELFEENPMHPGLHTELLEPKRHHIYSFRITKRYRAIFIYHGSEAVEIIDINGHYQ